MLIYPPTSTQGSQNTTGMLFKFCELKKKVLTHSHTCGEVQTSVTATDNNFCSSFQSLLMQSHFGFGYNGPSRPNEEQCDKGSVF